MKENLKKNAINSIEMGLEDFKSYDDRRLISSTRNIFAGILLLFKLKLATLHPTDPHQAISVNWEAEKDKSGKIIFKSKKGKSKNTLGVREIMDRFKLYGIMNGSDWSSFEKLNVYRNEIEHKFSEEEKDNVLKFIRDSFILIDGFVRNELNEDPAIFFGEKAWRTLLDNSEIYKLEKAMSIRSLDSISYEDLNSEEIIKNSSCHYCGFDLLKLEPINGADLSRFSDAFFTCISCKSSYHCYEILLYSSLKNKSSLKLNKIKENYVNLVFRERKSTISLVDINEIINITKEIKKLKINSFNLKSSGSFSFNVIPLGDKESFLEAKIKNLSVKKLIELHALFFIGSKEEISFFPIKSKFTEGRMYNLIRFNSELDILLSAGMAFVEGIRGSSYFK